VTLGLTDTSGHERTVSVTLRVPDKDHDYALGVQFGFGIAYTQGSPGPALSTAAASTGTAMTLVLGALGDLGRHIATSPRRARPASQDPSVSRRWLATR